MIILENKLKSTTSYTTRQISGWKQVDAQSKLTVRSVEAKTKYNTSIEKVLKKNSELNISDVIRVDGGLTGQINSVQVTIQDLSKF